MQRASQGDMAGLCDYIATPQELYQDAPVKPQGPGQGAGGERCTTRASMDWQGHVQQQEPQKHSTALTAVA